MNQATMSRRERLAKREAILLAVSRQEMTPSQASAELEALDAPPNLREPTQPEREPLREGGGR